MTITQSVDHNNGNLRKIRDENGIEKFPVSTDALIIRTNNKGGWKYARILLVNQGLATLAFFGVGVNLVLFLTRVLEQDNATAANNISKWTGTVYLCSLIGAFLSDSYWGRFLTCSIFQLIFLAGLGLLSLSSWLFLIKPNDCGDGLLLCTHPSKFGVGIFYLSIYLVALGYGGHQPTLATFGTDQFDDSTLEGKKNKDLFFGYFYFALNAGSLISNTILVYFEDNGKWTIGFLASLGSAVLALLLYLSGYRQYRYVKGYGNPVIRVAQVFVAAFKKRKIDHVEEENLYELKGLKSAIKGSRKILHTPAYQCLDKAATVTPDELNGEINPWRLCTVTQVEEAKCVLKLIPIWLCTIVYSVIFTQMASLFVEQGDVMNNKLDDFHIPASSMSVFDIVSVLISTGLYRYALIPIAMKIRGNRDGFSQLERMGIGLIIGILAMVAAGITEIARLRHIIPGEKHSTLSIFCQVPQYVLVGVSEVFMYVAQLDFFNDQAPDGIKSFGTALNMASISCGNFSSSLLVFIVMGITSKGDNHGWIPENLNLGHIDRFYFLIAGLAVFDFVIYLYFAKRYKNLNLDQGSSSGSGSREKEVEMEIKQEQVLGRV